MQLDVSRNSNALIELERVIDSLVPNRAPEPCLHQLFEEQADALGAAAALICGGTTLSYAELETEANKLGHYLRELGARKGSLVGLFLEKSHLPIVAILACLKAGAGYVPLDPAFPDERIAYIVGEAEIALVLTEDALRERAAALFDGKAVSLRL